MRQALLRLICESNPWALLLLSTRTSLFLNILRIHLFVVGKSVNNCVLRQCIPSRRKATRLVERWNSLVSCFLLVVGIAHTSLRRSVHIYAFYLILCLLPGSALFQLRTVQIFLVAWYRDVGWGTSAIFVDWSIYELLYSRKGRGLVLIASDWLYLFTANVDRDRPHFCLSGRNGVVFLSRASLINSDLHLPDFVALKTRFILNKIVLLWSLKIRLTGNFKPRKNFGICDFGLRKEAFICLSNSLLVVELVFSNPLSSIGFLIVDRPAGVVTDVLHFWI